jgi:hypothetical protein
MSTLILSLGSKQRVMRILITSRWSMTEQTRTAKRLTQQETVGHDNINTTTREQTEGRENTNTTTRNQTVGHENTNNISHRSRKNSGRNKQSNAAATWATRINTIFVHVLHKHNTHLYN